MGLLCSVRRLQVNGSVSAPAAEWLAQRQPALVGIDAWHGVGTWPVRAYALVAQ